jgi:hypothetical protein
VAALLFAALLCGVLALRPFRNSPDIRSDGVGYHIWAHAIAHGNLTFCNYGSLLKPVGALSGESLDGLRCKNKYPPGVALLQLAFSWPVLAKHPTATGFSVGENRVVLWGGAVLLFVVTALMSRVLARRGHTPFIALFSVGAFVFGTGLFHYSTYDASFSHIYSAFGAALALWLVYGKARLSIGRLVAFSLVVAWLYAVRQTNAAVGLAVVYLFFRQAAVEDGRRVAFSWLAGTAFSASLLLAYGHYSSGRASLSSYGAEGFPSFGGHAIDVLVSYERGLFSYYPLFFVTVVLALWRWRKPTSQAFLALVGAFTLLYGSWHAWQLGAGFGHRGFVELAPFGMLALAEALSAMSTTARRVSVILVGVCCMVTLMAMSAYWRRDLPFSGAVGAQYWQSISPFPVSASEKLKYSEDDVRHIRLAFEGPIQKDGAEWKVRIMVTNGNPLTRMHGAAEGYPPLRLSWRVVSQEKDIHKGWVDRLDLPALAPGESRAVTISVAAPIQADSGQQLQLAIVQEGMFWSHDIGVAPVSLTWTRDETASLNMVE